MFVYSLRASTVKFFGIVFIALAALTTLVVFIPQYEAQSTSLFAENKEINFDKIKTNEDRIAFLAQFGWTVENTPAEEAEITVPAEFDKVFTEYNEIQKRQGLDLSKYKNKDMKRYTYIVTNYPDVTETVYANVIVYKNRVVGGDICSASKSGFIHGFEASGNISLKGRSE